jgi:hypothetical protein
VCFFLIFAVSTDSTRAGARNPLLFILLASSEPEAGTNPELKALVKGALKTRSPYS